MREPIDKCYHWRDDAHSECGYCERCLMVAQLHLGEEE